MTYPNEPDLAPIGERLRERTAPLAPNDSAYGYAHAYLCGALGAIFDQVQQAFDPEGDVPPIAPLLDPATCPDWALPWLAQFVGTVLPVGTTADDARYLISSVAGFKRGTPAAMRSAASYYLTGAKTMYFRERDGDPYVLEVVTLTAETPDPAAVQRALTALKPGGLVLNYRTVVGWDYQEMTIEGGLYSALPTTFTSYRRMSNNERG